MKTDGPSFEDRNLGAQDKTAPFAILRARGVLGSVLVLILISFSWFESIWSGGFKVGSNPAVDGALGIFCYCLVLLCLAGMLRYARLHPETLFGLLPSRAVARASVLVGCALALVAVASYYFLYLPLSYLFPGFVERLVLEKSTEFRWQDSIDVLANLVLFTGTVVCAPVIEEFVFRGLLLTRWSLKWGTPRAVLFSSLLFAAGHRDLIGAFVFGYVASVLYIRTQSLFVPIIVHATNNFIAVLIKIVESLVPTSETCKTLVQWQSDWVLPLVAGVVVAPWLFRFTRLNIPKRDWNVPYFSFDTALDVSLERDHGVVKKNL